MINYELLGEIANERRNYTEEELIAKVQHNVSHASIERTVVPPLQPVKSTLTAFGLSLNTFETADGFVSKCGSWTLHGTGNLNEFHNLSYQMFMRYAVTGKI